MCVPYAYHLLAVHQAELKVCALEFWKWLGTQKVVPAARYFRFVKFVLVGWLVVGIGQIYA